MKPSWCDGLTDSGTISKITAITSPNETAKALVFYGFSIMYESKKQPLLPARHFRYRLLAHVFYALIVMVVTMAIGVIAHLILEPINWHDALLNTALIIGGLGPYIVPESVAGKVFFALYSMFVGLVFIGTLGLILAPLAHRIIHKFHLDDDQDL